MSKRKDLQPQRTQQPRRPPSRAFKKSHTARNVTIIASLVLAVVVLAVVLSAPPASQFFIIVHVYDSPNTYTSVEQLPTAELVANITDPVNVTVTGPRNLGNTTPTGILQPTFQVPGGNYTITAQKFGYQTATVNYVVGPSCIGKDQNGICHALVRMTKTS